MKSMKKLVLAGLVLLASMVVLAGCKNDSVSESTPVTETVQEIPYLTFSAEAEQTMTISTIGTYTLHESLEYSVNGGDWKQLVVRTPITFGGENGDLRLRGKSAGGTGTDYNNYATVSFGNSDVMVSCTGDIRTLVDWEVHTTASTSEARFIRLFYGCTSLTTAPTLPAETLADYCYADMFYGCTSLTTAPALPATTLADYCYSDMFSDCTSLTTAPTLPAETLAEYCYASMFSCCTSLTSAPALPAITLADYCYEYMFYGCTSLNSVTMLATDISAKSCWRNWLKDVAATGTFTKAAGLEQGDGKGQIPTGSHGIPSGWTVVDYKEQEN
ncbi:MAG: leucine-rich repeat protein [Spirochaetaceae bacterium]|nr:leucine-rich repeat protein [Spirochaetaceae bacterium]